MNTERIRISQLPEASASEITENIQLPLNTEANKTKRKSWSDIASILGLKFNTRSTGASISASAWDCILADASLGNITITLPSAVQDIQIIVKKTDASVNNITVTAAAGLVEGAASYSFSTAKKSRTFICDGTNWHII